MPPGQLERTAIIGEGQNVTEPSKLSYRPELGVDHDNDIKSQHHQPYTRQNQTITLSTIIQCNYHFTQRTQSPKFKELHLPIPAKHHKRKCDGDTQ
jgi:hypothetical protein